MNDLSPFGRAFWRFRTGTLTDQDDLDVLIREWPAFARVWKQELRKAYETGRDEAAAQEDMVEWLQAKFGEDDRISETALMLARIPRKEAYRTLLDAASIDDFTAT